jgi:hypothetical protein
VLEAVERHPKEVVYRIRREDAREDEAEHDSQEHQTPVVSTEAAGGGCECLEPLLQRNSLILRERVRGRARVRTPAVISLMAAAARRGEVSSEGRRGD